MDIYKEMYYALFDATMRAMEVLQEAHRRTEAMLMLHGPEGSDAAAQEEGVPMEKEE